MWRQGLLTLSYRQRRFVRRKPQAIKTRDWHIIRRLRTKHPSECDCRIDWRDGIEFFTLNDEGKLVGLLTVENLGQLMQQIKGKS